MLSVALSAALVVGLATSAPVQNPALHTVARLHTLDVGIPVVPTHRHLPADGQALIQTNQAGSCQAWDSAKSVGWCREGAVIENGGNCTTECFSSSYLSSVAVLTCKDGVFEPEGFTCDVVGCKMEAKSGMDEDVCIEAGYGANGMPTGASCTLKCKAGLVGYPTTKVKCIGDRLEPAEYGCMNATDLPKNETAPSTNGTKRTSGEGLPIECPAGSYADKLSKSGCSSCPAHSTTHVVRALHRSECICQFSHGYKGQILEESGSCEPAKCSRDHYVTKHQCTPCLPGFEREAGDLASGDETECTPTLCLAGYRVSNHACVKCSLGTNNNFGDLASGDDTTCEVLECLSNQYVKENQCRNCAAGKVSTVQPMNGPDTICDNCAEGKFRLSRDMVAPCQSCPDGSTTLTAGSTDGTACLCNEGYIGSVDVAGAGGCFQKACVCENGVPGLGLTCPQDGAAVCVSCNSGYKLTDEATCLAHECKCINGIAASAELCPVEGAISCTSCDPGYKKTLSASRDTFECIEQTCDNGIKSWSGASCECNFGYMGGGAYDAVHEEYPDCEDMYEVPCVGSWSVCQEDCTKMFTVQTNGSIHGAPCITTDGAVADCFEGLCLKAVSNTLDEEPCVADWTVCDESCTQTYTQAASTTQQDGGAGCFLPLGSTRSCLGGTCTNSTADEKPCLGYWGTCDAMCEQTYSIAQAAEAGGVGCPHVEGAKRACKGTGECQLEERTCMGHWGACHHLKCTRMYTIDQMQSGGGAECPYLNGETESCQQCDNPPTIEACEGVWGPCDDNCMETYKVTKTAKFGGPPCPFANGDSRPCTGDDCMSVPANADCEGSWSTCAEDCTSTYVVVKKRQGMGQNCTNFNGDTRWCSVGAGSCHQRSASVDAVGEWSECTSACTSTFVVENSGNFGGRALPFANGEIKYCAADEGKCENPPAATDCVGEFGTCTADCKKEYKVTAQATFGGMECAYANGFKKVCSSGEGSCSNDNVDCAGSWSVCSATCDRVYTVAVPVQNGGSACEASDGDTQACTGGLCTTGR